VGVLGSDLGVSLRESGIDLVKELRSEGWELGPMGPGWRSSGRPAGSDKRACAAYGRGPGRGSGTTGQRAGGPELVLGPVGLGGPKAVTWTQRSGSEVRSLVHKYSRRFWEKVD
jgi:hypothetical protein